VLDDTAERGDRGLHHAAAHLGERLRALAQDRHAGLTEREEEPAAELLAAERSLHADPDLLTWSIPESADGLAVLLDHLPGGLDGRRETALRRGRDEVAARGCHLVRRLPDRSGKVRLHPLVRCHGTPPWPGAPAAAVSGHYRRRAAPDRAPATAFGQNGT
jgi:hypothetical protein